MRKSMLYPRLILVVSAALMGSVLPLARSQVNPVGFDQPESLGPLLDHVQAESRKLPSVAGASLQTMRRAKSDIRLFVVPASRDSKGDPALVLAADFATGRERAYSVGDTVAVLINNDGEKPYVFNPYFAACAMTFRETGGRKFKIPPGTHCDMVGEETIEPGQTKTLFTWNLDECLEDNWGCVRSQSLPAGNYTVKGVFYNCLEARYCPGKPRYKAEAKTTVVIINR